jgi:hypothetical protein
VYFGIFYLDFYKEPHLLEYISIFSTIFSVQLPISTPSDTGRFMLWQDLIRDYVQSWETVLFGVGFGKKFIPDTFSELMVKDKTLISLVDQEARFDPHNSQLSLLYRIGIIGIVGYVTILWEVYKHGIRTLRSISDYHLKILQVGLMAGFANVFAQSFVSVIMENPQNGIFYWLSLGMCITCSRIIADKNIQRNSSISKYE